MKFVKGSDKGLKVGIIIIDLGSIESYTGLVIGLSRGVEIKIGWSLNKCMKTVVLTKFYF